MQDSDYMRLAISQARRAMGNTHPNPAVGAVIVHQGEVVAQGHTQPAGHDHAEIVALKAFSARQLLVDDTTRLYVTMEPCCTHGRTPPCTSALIDSGINQVVTGATDPNPQHSGKGLDILRQAGIHVTSGVLEQDCEDLNLLFNWSMQQSGPLFAGKIATTIDGRIATRGGSSKWITGQASRANVHFWRNYFPAIAVGAGTVMADNPSLTVRIKGEPEKCPVRFVFDRNLNTFRDGSPNVYHDRWRQKTIVVCNSMHEQKVVEIRKRHDVQFWMFEDTLEASGFSDFHERCSQEGIQGIFFEGGARLLSSLLQMRYLHYLFAYRAPKILADQSALAPFHGLDPVTMQDAIKLVDVRHEQFGEDQLMRGFLSNHIHQGVES